MMSTDSTGVAPCHSLGPSTTSLAKDSASARQSAAARNLDCLKRSGDGGSTLMMTRGAPSAGGWFGICRFDHAVLAGDHRVPMEGNRETAGHLTEEAARELERGDEVRSTPLEFPGRGRMNTRWPFSGDNPHKTDSIASSIEKCASAKAWNEFTFGAPAGSTRRFTALNPKWARISCNRPIALSCSNWRSTRVCGWAR